MDFMKDFSDVYRLLISIILTLVAIRTAWIAGFHDKDGKPLKHLKNVFLLGFVLALIPMAAEIGLGSGDVASKPLKNMTTSLIEKVGTALEKAVK